MLDDSKLVQHFPALLTALKKRIKSLPSSLPLGDADGHLSRYFGDLEVDAEEGAAFSANRQWERVFQGSEEEKRSRIVRGPHGLDLDGIKGTVNVGMLARRIHGLNSLLDSICSAWTPRDLPKKEIPTHPHDCGVQSPLELKWESIGPTFKGNGPELSSQQLIS
ncbi:hypothetical protein FB451DRAFT_1172822 [Mycena latifolia]|nr:hypothetical protein FB451DRAFT_1172822 [Mycena latifolia]